MSQTVFSQRTDEVRVKEVESGFPKQIRTQPKSMSVLNWKPNLNLFFIFFGKNKQSSSTRELSRSKCSRYWSIQKLNIYFRESRIFTWKLSRLDECKIELITDTVYVQKYKSLSSVWIYFCFFDQETVLCFQNQINSLGVNTFAHIVLEAQTTS